MAQNIPLTVYPVKDIEASKKFFTVYLGTEPYVDSAYYVGYRIGDQEIGLDPSGTAVISYIDSLDIEADLQVLQTAGAEVIKPVTDVGAGLRVAQVAMDGNVLGLRQQPAA